MSHAFHHQAIQHQQHHDHTGILGSHSHTGPHGHGIHPVTPHGYQTHTGTIAHAHGVTVKPHHGALELNKHQHDPVFNPPTHGWQPVHPLPPVTVHHGPVPHGPIDDPVTSNVVPQGHHDIVIYPPHHVPIHGDSGLIISPAPQHLQSHVQQGELVSPMPPSTGPFVPGSCGPFHHIPGLLGSGHGVNMFTQTSHHVMPQSNNSIHNAFVQSTPKPMNDIGFTGSGSSGGFCGQIHGGFPIGHTGGTIDVSGGGCVGHGGFSHPSGSIGITIPFGGPHFE